MAVKTLLVGCGRLGGAILTGWRTTGAVDMSTLGVLTPSSKPAADAAASEGARLNPQDLSAVEAVVLAVKPAKWREAVSGFAERLPAGAVIVSVMAGVRTEALAEGLAGRRAARSMPTTAVSAGRGASTIFAADTTARAVAHRLFDPLGETVDVDDENLIDVATGVSGSGAAYAYAFVRALRDAAVRAGMGEGEASVLARATVDGALQRLGEGDDPAALIAEVASPGGTTEAGLKVLEPRLNELVDATVQAALKRARELSA